MGIKTEIITQNLRTLIQKNPPLPYVLSRLATTDIRYGLYAGAHVAVLTGNRTPTDVDMLVHDEDLPKLHALFPFAKTEDLGDGVFLYIGEDDRIEFMGAAEVVKDGHTYPFRLSDEASERLTSYTVDGHTIHLVDPIDSLVLKSILQRGPEQGKHDLEDISAVLQATDIDTEYLRRRLDESGAFDIGALVFKNFDIEL